MLDSWVAEWVHLNPYWVWARKANHEPRAGAWCTGHLRKEPRYCWQDILVLSAPGHDDGEIQSGAVVNLGFAFTCHDLLFHRVMMHCRAQTVTLNKHIEHNLTSPLILPAAQLSNLLWIAVTLAQTRFRHSKFGTKPYRTWDCLDGWSLSLRVDRGGSLQPQTLNPEHPWTYCRMITRSTFCLRQWPLFRLSGLLMGHPCRIRGDSKVVTVRLSLNVQIHTAYKCVYRYIMQICLHK